MTLDTALEKLLHPDQAMWPAEGPTVIARRRCANVYAPPLNYITSSFAMTHCFCAIENRAIVAQQKGRAFRRHVNADAQLWSALTGDGVATLVLQGLPRSSFCFKCVVTFESHKNANI